MLRKIENDLPPRNALRNPAGQLAGTKMSIQILRNIPVSLEPKYEWYNYMCPANGLVLHVRFRVRFGTCSYQTPSHRHELITKTPL